MLAIVIVSYNCRGDLDACLSSLAAAPPRVPHQIVVVDNASSDGTPDHVRQRWPHVRLIDSGGNRGFAAANNIGIRATSGDMVLLLNPDTVVPPGAIDALRDALLGSPDAAIAGPRIEDERGRRELSFGPMLSPWAELRQKVLVVGNERGWPGVPRLVRGMTERPCRPDWVSGACLLIRRADLEAAGGLDERYFLYTEDVDLCASVRARGRAVLFVPHVVITHRRGRSAATAPLATRLAYRQSHLAFYEKHLPQWVPLLKRYLALRGEWPLRRMDGTDGGSTDT